MLFFLPALNGNVMVREELVVLQTVEARMLILKQKGKKASELGAVWWSAV